MAKLKRCPNCGASNPESAQWCSLCLERFDKPVPEADAHADETDAGTTAEAKPKRDYSAFEVTDDGIKWICPTCSTANNLDVPQCTVCGSTFADAVRPKPVRPERDPATVALFSLFLPGAGHAYMGMWGQAVARGILSLWVLVVAVVGLLDRDVPGSLIMALLFGVAAFALWLAAAHDAYREATNDTHLVLLRGRRFLYVVLGLMALLFVVMFMALITARRQVDDAALHRPTSIQGWPSTSSPTFMELPTN